MFTCKLERRTTQTLKFKFFLGLRLAPVTKQLAIRSRILYPTKMRMWLTMIISGGELSRVHNIYYELLELFMHCNYKIPGYYMADVTAHACSSYIVLFYRVANYTASYMHAQCNSY